MDIRTKIQKLRYKQKQKTKSFEQNIYIFEGVALLCYARGEPSSCAGRLGE